MKRFFKTLLQFVVLSITLHLLFDIVGWLVFNAPIQNKQSHYFLTNNFMAYVHVPR